LSINQAPLTHKRPLSAPVAKAEKKVKSQPVDPPLSAHDKAGKRSLIFHQKSLLPKNAVSLRTRSHLQLWAQLVLTLLHQFLLCSSRSRGIVCHFRSSNCLETGNTLCLMQSLSVPLWPRFLRVHRLDPDGRQVRVLDPKIAHVKSGAQYFFQYFASSPLEVKPSCVEVGDDEDSDTSKNSMVGADAEEDQETSAHPQVPKASAQPPVINKFPCVACGTNVPCLSRELDLPCWRCFNLGIECNLDPTPLKSSPTVRSVEVGVHGWKVNELSFDRGGKLRLGVVFAADGRQPPKPVAGGSATPTGGSSDVYM